MEQPEAELAMLVALFMQNRIRKHGNKK